MWYPYDRFIRWAYPFHRFPWLRHPQQVWSTSWASVSRQLFSGPSATRRATSMICLPTSYLQQPKRVTARLLTRTWGSIFPERGIPNARACSMASLNSASQSFTLSPPSGFTIIYDFSFSEKANLLKFSLTDGFSWGILKAYLKMHKLIATCVRQFPFWLTRVAFLFLRRDNTFFRRFHNESRYCQMV